MKIDNSLTGVRGITPGKGKTERNRNATTNTLVPDSGCDSVDITSTSSRLQRLEATLADINSEDTEKVEAIRQAIAEGRYQVDEDAVAEKLIQNTLEQLRFGGR